MLANLNSSRFAVGMVSFLLGVCVAGAAPAFQDGASHEVATESAGIIEVDLGAEWVTIDIESGEHKPLDSPPFKGAISPDGSRIAHVDVAKSGDAMLVISDLLPDGVIDDAGFVLTTGGMKPSEPVWLPDGSSLLFAGAADGKWQVFSVDPRDPSAKPEIFGDSAKPARRPRVSAQGAIAYLETQRQEGKATLSNVIVIEEGHSRIVETERSIHAIEWSPDGSQLAWSETGTLAIHDLETGQTRLMSIPDLADGLWNHHASSLAWRPDGRAIAARFVFSGGRQSDPRSKPEPMFGDRQVFVIELEGESEVRSLELPADVRGLRWLADEASE